MSGHEPDEPDEVAMDDEPKRKCEKETCDNLFTPRGNMKYCCSDCRVPEKLKTPSNSQSKRAEKRSAGSPISPRMEDLSKQELLAKLKQSLQENTKLTGAIEALGREIVSTKIAFVDREYQRRTTVKDIQEEQNVTYADIAKHNGNRNTVLVAKTNAGADAGSLNSEAIEKLLEPDKGGPFVQHVSVKHNKIVITFNDNNDRDKARKILESKPVFSSAVKSLTAQPKHIQWLDSSPVQKISKTSNKKLSIATKLWPMELWISEA